MDTTGADFYAYQFKPLVKLLNAATTGMLIADEVGLGKTIEAGLIWTELRGRFDYKRLLVLCPAMLREKWRRELRSRFGVEPEVVDAERLVERLRLASSEPESARFALIASLQGTRPPRDWRDNEAIRSPTAALARLLDSEQQQTTLVDLAVIDEAHYLRNPETMTHELGLLVRGIAEYLVLLSATPVHLKNRDLYQLVHLADPATFSRPQEFEDLLSANEPLVRARELVLSGRATREALRGELETASANPLLRGSKQIAALLNDLPDDERLRNPTAASELGWRLETVNLLGHVVTRTRKRQIQEWRVVREAKDVAVDLTGVEKDFYEQVTEVVRDYCTRAGSHEGFLLVMPQRQMASSMAAAYRAWARGEDSATESAYEALGVGENGIDDDDRSSDEQLGPLVRELVDRVGPLASYQQLRASDSKYQMLRSELLRHFAKNPNDKVVLFSYFRPTLSYLKERFAEDGIGAVLLHGGIEDKDAAVEEFRERPGATVLLSSEVGSEGIDLQFAWIVINYDLPWNPMRVEQRIGRLDRLGQKSEKIAIWNLFYSDTIDERIYRRLYERLGIFERTLGGIEPILAKELQRLTSVLLTQRLTPEQEEERIEQTRRALANKQAEEERLEREAAYLVAYGDYIVNQIHAARDLSRKIEGADLLAYVREFVLDHYSGSELRQTPDSLDFEVTLSQRAGGELEEFLRAKRIQGSTRMARPGAARVPCRFENTVTSPRGPIEVVNQLHPLVRFVSDRIQKTAADTVRPAVGALIERVRAPGSIPQGDYAFSVQQWSMHGVQEWEFLHFCAVALGSHESLSSEDAERLVNLAAEHGRDWISVGADVEIAAAVTAVDECCLVESRAAFEKKRDELFAQNEDRALIQERTLERHYQSQRIALEGQLAQHRARGTRLVAATEGKLRALDVRVSRKRAEIEVRRRFDAHPEELCVGVIRVLS